MLHLAEEQDRQGSTFGVVNGSMVDGTFYRGARTMIERIDDAARTDAMDGTVTAANS